MSIGSRCVMGDIRISMEQPMVVRLDRAKSGVPIKLGQELCQVRPDHTGHFQINESILSDLGSSDDSDSDGSNGPIMVATDEYRSGWERTFGSKNMN